MVQRLLPGMSPSSLAFYASLIWVQVHDYPMDWCKEAIVRGIVSFVGLVTEIDKFFLANAAMRSVIVRVKFELSRALVLSLDLCMYVLSLNTNISLLSVTFVENYSSI